MAGMGRKEQQSGFSSIPKEAPSRGKGLPCELETMVRIHLMQNWWSPSDEGSHGT